MPESTSFEPEITEVAPQIVAIVRGQVAVSDMTEFFARAFDAVTRVVGNAGGVEIVGPPIGVYYAIAQTVADIGAGFPVDAGVSATFVQSASLPGGRAVQVTHQGPYETLEQTYASLMDWFNAQGIDPGPLRWESYLNEPDPDAPETALTRITWPLPATPGGA